jgi:hypothetical protein
VGQNARSDQQSLCSISQNDDPGGTEQRKPRHVFSPTNNVR